MTQDHLAVVTEHGPSGVLSDYILEHSPDVAGVGIREEVARCSVLLFTRGCCLHADNKRFHACSDDAHMGAQGPFGCDEARSLAQGHAWGQRSLLQRLTM